MAEQRALPCTVQGLLALLESEARTRKDTFHRLGLATDSSKESLEDAQQYLKYIQTQKFTTTYDEVYPNIFVGGENAARDKETLQQLGIGHVLNTAQGSGIGQVDTDEKYYLSSGIRFKGLPLEDAEETDVTKNLDEVSDFIDDAINNKGKVLVHCVLGLSRSPTIVAAYLMHRRGLTATEALKSIRRRREIHPNSGFLQQLCDLDMRLKHGRTTRMTSI